MVVRLRREMLKPPPARSGMAFFLVSMSHMGGRKHLEDYVCMGVESDNDAFYAVFDGHSGNEAAQYARDNLWKMIKSSDKFDSDDPAKVSEAIVAGFVKTHESMKGVRDSWNKTKDGYPNMSGTTVACALFRGDHIFIANVGDSAIVLGKANPKYGKRGEQKVIAQCLTTRHVPNNKEERERIENLGGSVSAFNRVVWGQKHLLQSNGRQINEESLDKMPKLNMSRSLGDLWSAVGDEYLISPIPDVYIHALDLTEDMFLILGTDGLWDTITPQQSVAIVDHYCEGEFDHDKIAMAVKVLVNMALDRWNKILLRAADNVTAMVVKFGAYNIKNGKLQIFSSGNQINGESSQSSDHEHLCNKGCDSLSAIASCIGSTKFKRANKNLKTRRPLIKRKKRWPLKKHRLLFRKCQLHHKVD